MPAGQLKQFGKDSGLARTVTTPIGERLVDSTSRRNTLTSEVFKDGDGRLE